MSQFLLDPFPGGDAVADYVARCRRSDFPPLDIAPPIDLFPEQPTSTNFSAPFTWKDSWTHNKKAGVYLIYSASFELLYIGTAQQLGARLSQHFGSGSHCRVPDYFSAMSPRYVINIAVPTGMAFEAPSLKAYLIDALQPVGNTDSGTTTSDTLFHRNESQDYLPTRSLFKPAPKSKEPHTAIGVIEAIVSRMVGANKIAFRTIVFLVVAVTFFLNVHVITGFGLPKIVSKETLGFSETFININAITAMPRIAAESMYPLSCKALKREKLIESDYEFEQRMEKESQEEAKRIQEQVQENIKKSQKEMLEAIKKW